MHVYVRTRLVFAGLFLLMPHHTAMARSIGLCGCTSAGGFKFFLACVATIIPLLQLHVKIFEDGSTLAPFEALSLALYIACWGYIALLLGIEACKYVLPRGRWLLRFVASFASFCILSLAFSVQNHRPNRYSACILHEE